jgi:hypothetical protein
MKNTYLFADGTILTSKLYASKGKIGGWTMDSSSLTGGGSELNSDGTITCNKLVANNSGSIAGFTITKLTGTI